MSVLLNSAPSMSMSLAKGAGGANVKARSRARGMPAVVAKQNATDGTRSTTTTTTTSSLVAATTAVGLLIAVPTLDAFAASSSSAPSVFVGEYADPKHPGCLRSIVVGDDAGATTLDVKGTDGTPGCANGEKQRPWSLTGDIVKVPSKQDEILIDFSPKGGPKNLLGKWTGTGILFPDGNEWKKLKN